MKATYFSRSEHPRGNAGIVVAIILAILALIVAIISAFFYINLWSNDQSTSRSYSVFPKPVVKNTNASNENTNSQATNENANVNTNVVVNTNDSTNINTNTEDELVHLTTPAINATVTNPIEIAGSAPGRWFFEAVFPITLVDADGNELARTQAQATGDWMTTNQVDFTASLEYTATETQTVELVFQPDNPSGMPNSTSYSIPVTLTASE